MSLIWNELGSYIKGTSGSHKEEKTGNTMQNEEEISLSKSYNKEADNPVESDNNLPKNNSLDDIKQNNEKLYTSNESKSSISSNEVVVDSKEHSKLTTSKSSSTDILTKIHSVEVISKKDSKNALDGKCITAKHEIEISDNLHTKTNSSRQLPNKNNEPSLDFKNSSVLQNKDNEKEVATEKDKEKSPKEKSERPAEISSIKTQIENVLVQCDKKLVDATTKPIEKEEETPKKAKETTYKNSGAEEKDAAKCDTKERSLKSSDQGLHSKKAITRDAFSASRSSSLLGKKRESSKSVPRKSDYGKRALCTSDTDEDTSDDDSTSEDEDKTIENKKGPKNEEKCTIKKRRKQYKSVDTPSKNQQTPVKDKVAPENKELEDKDQASSSHKKSKIGAKRKPTDASRGSFSQESEEIKRRKFLLMKNLKHGFGIIFDRCDCLFITYDLQIINF